MGVEKRGRRWRFSIHSLRKFFKTQMIVKGVEESVVDYMMGHVTDAYTRISSMGTDWLRNKYMAANLRIREKVDKKELKEFLRELVRSRGYDPEEFIKPGITYISPEVSLAKTLLSYIDGDSRSSTSPFKGSRIDQESYLSRTLSKRR